MSPDGIQMTQEDWDTIKAPKQKEQEKEDAKEQKADEAEDRKQAERTAKNDFKASLQGKCEEWLKGIVKDKTKLSTLGKDLKSSACGKGVARDEKANILDNVEILEKLEKAFEKIKAADDDPKDLAETAKGTVDTVQAYIKKCRKIVNLGNR